MKNIFLSLFLFTITTLFGETDFLFYLQDAGETYALLPVMRELDERGKSVTVLACGAADELVGNEFKRISFPESTIDKKWSREQTLSSEELNSFVDSIHPKVVVTGVAYTLQGQVIEAFGAKQVPTVAYWDNFNLNGENPYFKTAQKVAALARQVFVPTQDLGDHFGMKAVVVGQPTLEEWASKIHAREPIAIRQELAICTCKKVVLFIGGYGKEYLDSLDLYAASLEKSDISDLFALIQPHPKSADGEAEEAIMMKYDVPFRVLRGEITTQEATDLSSLVGCHQSTAAFQALAVGKPVIHFIPKSQEFKSLLLDKGLAFKVTEPTEFDAMWEKGMNASERGDFFSLLGAPRNSVQLCVEGLLELVD